MRKGKEYEVLIDRTEFPGYGTGECEGEKVYIKNALPGQKLRVKIFKKKSGHFEGKALEVLEDVDYKIPPVCKQFGQCGGCTHQFISYQKQLEFKETQVRDLFMGADVHYKEFLPIQGSPEDLGYRNKMEFTFGDAEKGGELCLGMHMRERNFSIVTVDDCRIVDSDFRTILKEVLAYFRAKGLPHYRILSHEGYLRNLVVRKGRNTGEIMINIVTTSSIDFDFAELTDILKSIKYEGTLTSLLHTVNDSLSDVVKSDRMGILFGRDYIVENILGLTFKIFPFSFFQTNSKGAEKLYSIVRDFLGDTSSKTVFDLYCGTGTIGQIVAPKAKKVVGVELVEEAVKAARENAAFNGLNNCEFIAGDIAKVIKDITYKPDYIVLDPPRAGVHPVAMEYVTAFNAPSIVYVSCNPKSLVNDLKVLEKAGYEVQTVVPVDMFPMTGHVETVCLLTSKIKAFE